VAQASSTAGNVPVTANNILATSPSNIYSGPTNLVALNAGSVTNVGGSQAHLNMQPFLTLSFCIALQGIFPSPT
jgi:microcystin-dependent protein